MGIVDASCTAGSGIESELGFHIVLSIYPN